MSRSTGSQARLLYAIIGWKTGLWRKCQPLALGFTLPTRLLFLASPLWLLTGLLLVADLFVPPLYINAFLLIDATATDDTRTEANLWVGANERHHGSSWPFLAVRRRRSCSSPA
ncbi:hypothetical protein AB0C40_08255 [Streptomyces brevispora]|uniref:hypothetical protein n=1 Tax=Streptomyces brevispora TaxID=887462 RepID=UPI0033DED379